MSKAATAEIQSEDGPTLPAIYARWTLDCVIQAARAVAIDFTSRPRQYKGVPAVAAKLLEAIWYRYGNDRDFPDSEQRKMICVPLVGESDAVQGAKSAQFHKSAAALRDRAWDFSNRQVTTGENNLRQAFLDDLTSFRSYLDALHPNSVVTNGSRQQRYVFDLAVNILKTDAIAAVFGRPAPVEADWPIGSFTETGARLIEEISMALEGAGPAISQSRFIVLQRIANYGARTIAGAYASDIEPDKLTAIDPLITLAYSWKTAIDAPAG